MGGARTGRAAVVLRRALTGSLGLPSPVATGKPGAASESESSAAGLDTTRMGLVTSTESSAIRFLLAALVRESRAAFEALRPSPALEEEPGEGLAMEVPR